VIEVQNHMQYQQAYDADALRGCYLNRSTIMSELLNRFDMIIRFEEPQFAISPGQILAIYDHDECLGGGVIQYSHGKFGMI
jgi:tRNA U34 2-thiouridine synthase MnmA/TrmU